MKGGTCLGKEIARLTEIDSTFIDKKKKKEEKEKFFPNSVLFGLRSDSGEIPQGWGCSALGQISEFRKPPLNESTFQSDGRNS